MKFLCCKTSTSKETITTPTASLSPLFTQYSQQLPSATMVRFLSILCLTVSSVAAFSTSSSFGGSVVSGSVQNGAMMEMKKGKANVPPQMRGQFKKQQETAAQQRQMVEAQRPGSDGMPVFNLFVRTKRQNVSIALFGGIQEYTSSSPY
jgi:hypothetical protein